MTNVVEFVVKNRQWIFDGVGVFVLGLLVSFGVFLCRRRGTKSSPPVNSAAVGTGNVSIGTVNIRGGGVSIGNTEAPRREPQYDELRRVGGGPGGSGVEGHVPTEKTHNLSDGEFDILRYLGVKMNSGPMTIAEIARGLKLRPVEVLAHVSRLASDGHVIEHMTVKGIAYRISGKGAQRLVGEPPRGRALP